MVVDQSAEPFPLNSRIPKGDGSVHLNTMHDLGIVLRRIRHELGHGTRLIGWKSDVSRAYRLMPVHVLWQILQVITFKDSRFVNRCNHFGNRAAGRIWGAFIGLVLWIGIKLKEIEDLLGYVDDIYPWDFEDNNLWYAPYNKLMPSKQVKLLELWDELGVPHEEKKQVAGSPLTIIGFEVDFNKMTITMPSDAQQDLITAIRSFAHFGQRRSLREFQSLAGWINWALNAYPLLRPGLSVLYSKISGKKTATQAYLGKQTALPRAFLGCKSRREI